MIILMIGLMKINIILTKITFEMNSKKTFTIDLDWKMRIRAREGMGIKKASNFIYNSFL